MHLFIYVFIWLLGFNPRALHSVILSRYISGAIWSTFQSDILKYVVVMKTLKKLEIEGTCLSITKATHDKP